MASNQDLKTLVSLLLNYSVSTRKNRPAPEWASEQIFRPLAQLFVPSFAALKVNPKHLVLSHTALGLYIAYLIRQGSGPNQRLRPALLLQLKTLLDGLDGQLARATKKTTLTGRYLDTEMDVLVNLALNIAIAGRAGWPLTLLQSLILTVDFLWEKEYRLARNDIFRDTTDYADYTEDNSKVLAALEGFYKLYFVPQEKVLTTLFIWRLQYITGPNPTPEQLLAYNPILPTFVASNLGLSTQLLWLGVCVWAGKPRLYLQSLYGQALLLIGVQLWREQQVRRLN